MKLHISPCPNDTFIFHAMTHHLVDTEGLVFDVTFEDIDCLNQRAERGDADVLKISCAVLPLVNNSFNLLHAGGALGYANAPIIVGKRGDIELQDCRIAIPGQRTTAALLLKNLIHPNAQKLHTYLFSDIADAVVSGRVDAGVLIHEGRFTYAEKGLKLIADLGELWSQQHDLPVPLGAIVVSKKIADYQQVERIIRRSVLYAMEHPEASAEFVARHAQELSADVRQKHISYFVNEYSIELGDKGIRAIATLLQ